MRRVSLCRAAALLPLALGALAVSATAQTAKGEVPWVKAGTEALPAGVKSAEILRDDEPLYQRPSRTSQRRGTVAKGVHLAIHAVSSGPGCTGRWLSVGPVAWVCEDVIRLSKRAPDRRKRSAPQFLDGLPYRYYFVGPDGSLGYRNLAQAEEGYPDAELEPGFAVAVVTVANKAPGDPFGLTTHRLWLPMRDLHPARPFTFQGETFDPKQPFGWVRAAGGAPVYLKPFGKREPEKLAQFERVNVLEEKQVAGTSFVRIDAEHWLRTRDIARPRLVAPPEEIRGDERWIDVDLEAQVLTAYAGHSPVFATLVSTGKGRAKSPQATPKGRHRIWVKLKVSDMDNLETEDASRYYAIQSVPWVMYFKQGYGLHGAFWHRDFGHVRSHGCVNLPPRDAQRLFHWASPHLPAGWTAAFPTEYEPGTLVQVR